MDNKINQIRIKIRALRLAMFEVEQLMRDQINQDEDCSWVAQQIMDMRMALCGLLKERRVLGDREAIVISFPTAPNAAKPPIVKPAAFRPLKRQLRRDSRA